MVQTPNVPDGFNFSFSSPAVRADNRAISPGCAVYKSPDTSTMVGLLVVFMAGQAVVDKQAPI
jgi:hypothetical protein